MKILKNYPLKKFTTMAIGGPAKFLVTVESENSLLDALKFAKNKKLDCYVVGDGSNLIPPDRGFNGIIIRNAIQKFDHRANTVKVGAGNNLLKFIFKLNSLGLAGLERMAGIPGTVGGAIYGSAGAYGQEIKEVLAKVKVFDGEKFRILTKNQCRFGYRESVFKKHKNWVITDAILKLSRGVPAKLQKISREIIKLREKKYKPGLKCPGSFFKNVKLADLSAKTRAKFLQKIPREKIVFGKVPTGYLLEEIGAKGMRQGSIRVASHHGNLIYNPTGGKATDIKNLALRLKSLVKKKFGITIKEEVQYLRR